MKPDTRTVTQLFELERALRRAAVPEAVRWKEKERGNRSRTTCSRCSGRGSGSSRSITPEVYLGAECYGLQASALTPRLLRRGGACG
jgi:hypothetical protein